MSLGPLYSLLGQVSVQVFCPFFNWVVCLPGVESCEFFIYFGNQTLVWEEKEKKKSKEKEEEEQPEGEEEQEIETLFEKK